MVTHLFVIAGQSLIHLKNDEQGWHTHIVETPQKFLCLAVDDNNPGRFYAGTFDDGLWRSDNFGHSWEPVGQGIQSKRIPSVAVSSTEKIGNYSVVWAGTEPSGVYRSEDGGHTWTNFPALLDLPSEPTWSFPPRPYTHHTKYIQPDIHEPERLFVGIELGGVMRSLDRGETWEDRKPNSQYDCHSLLMHPNAPGRVYEAAGGGYAETRDGGATWQTLNDGLEPFTYLVHIAVDSGDPDVILASAAKIARTAYRQETAETVIVRKVGQQPWKIVKDGLPSAKGSIVYNLIAHPERPGVFYAVNNLGIYESVDSGQTWQALPVQWPGFLKAERVRGFSSIVKLPKQ